jgi:hypothetical protein
MRQIEPEEQAEGQAGAPDSEQEKSNARHALGRYFPRLSGKDALRRFQPYDYKRQANRCKWRAYIYAHRVWRRVSSPPCVRRMLISAIAVGSIALIVLWWKGNADSNFVIAVFTIVMAITTYQNWAEMRTQNKIMVGQMEQTDQQIRHMRNEQRPWLAIVNARVKQTNEPKQPSLIYRFENSGPTPGIVMRITLALCVVHDARNAVFKKGLVDNVEPERCANVVPPNAGCDHEHVQISLNDELYSAMCSEDGWLGMIGFFQYIGPQGDVYETGFAFAYRADGQLRIVGTEQDNYMI